MGFSLRNVFFIGLVLFCQIVGAEDCENSLRNDSEPWRGYGVFQELLKQAKRDMKTQSFAIVLSEPVLGKHEKFFREVHKTLIQYTPIGVRPIDLKTEGKAMTDKLEFLEGERDRLIRGAFARSLSRLERMAFVIAESVLEDGEFQRVSLSTGLINWGQSGTENPTTTLHQDGDYLNIIFNLWVENRDGGTHLFARAATPDEASTDMPVIADSGHIVIVYGEEAVSWNSDKRAVVHRAGSGARLTYVVRMKKQ